MPIYEYICESCKQESEVLQKMSDPAPDVCASCGKGPLVKKVSMTSFALKGTGWYVTDFRGGSSKPKQAETDAAADATKETGASTTKDGSPSNQETSKNSTPVSSEVTKTKETNG